MIKKLNLSRWSMILLVAAGLVLGDLSGLAQEESPPETPLNPMNQTLSNPAQQNLTGEAAADAAPQPEVGSKARAKPHQNAKPNQKTKPKVKKKKAKAKLKKKPGKKQKKKRLKKPKKTGKAAARKKAKTKPKAKPARKAEESFPAEPLSEPNPISPAPERPDLPAAEALE